MVKSIKNVVIVGALLVACSPAKAQHFTFKYYQDTSTNAYTTKGTDLSPVGELVGWYTNFANGVWGFTESGGSYTTISVPTSGSPDTVINAISTGNKLLGYGSTSGFVRDTAGNLTQIAVPASFKATSLSNPLGINSSGTIVGTFSVAAGAQRGFILENGTYTTYQVPGSFSTVVHDISDSGALVGSYQTSNGGSSTGFVLNHGTLTTIEFPGANGTVATSINLAGHVVGYFFNKSQVLLPFYFDGTTYTQISTPGEYACVVQHIKNSGAIVGDCTNNSTFVTEAFVGTPKS